MIDVYSLMLIALVTVEIECLYCSATPQKAKEQKKEDLPGVKLTTPEKQVRVGDIVYCEVDESNRQPAEIVEIMREENYYRVHLFRWPKQNSVDKYFTKIDRIWEYQSSALLSILEPPTEITKGKRTFYRFQALESLIQ